MPIISRTRLFNAASGVCLFVLAVVVRSRNARCVHTACVLLESCLQTCVTYTIAECTENELLMMDKETVRNK